ncbi:hypothetical protein [Gordonia sihwensis]|uniref:hypothetical protein n=1 Tax=Gordonia sihwensis TaxID=173559 RepID=UPI003D95FE0D
MNNFDTNTDAPEIMTDTATGCRIRIPLVRAVEAASGLAWDAARLSWRVIGMDEDEDARGVCVCGQTGLRYLYTIVDDRTGASLHPVGSDCIAHFDDPTMSSAATAFADLAGLKRTIAACGVLGLADLSRRRLSMLHDRGLIDSREFEFLMSMFNRRRGMTSRQAAWADALMGRLTRQLPGVPLDARLGGAA